MCMCVCLCVQSTVLQLKLILAVQHALFRQIFMSWTIELNSGPDLANQQTPGAVRWCCLNDHEHVHYSFPSQKIQMHALYNFLFVHILCTELV